VSSFKGEKKKPAEVGFAYNTTKQRREVKWALKSHNEEEKEIF